ncbi:MAG: imidazoleglycerol-phosphate dehydratase HisB [Lachnospiraceae bacterium]|nr:imidazoleglycerol-phosphate dehydratase HisB [Lachnospiraceae bacterium]
MRNATVSRYTKETNIEISIAIDGSGTADVDTHIGFFDHMLNSFARHGLFDLTVNADGDTYVDCHHTVEDTGIVLGQAILNAVGDKASMKRFGSAIIPMDEALALCAIDFSGRPYLNFEVPFNTPRIGEFDTEMVREFFYAISYSAGMNIHIKLLSGINDHHICESVFKAFAKALDQATMVDDRIDGVLSTKGAL